MQVKTELKNQLARFDKVEKDVLINLHWTLEDFEQSDFLRLCEVMKATGKQEQDPQAFIKANLRQLP